MKKSPSETEFDKSDYTCPFLDGECQKDCCTHFERYKGIYENLKTKEEYNYGICHAGQHVQLWHESILTNKPPAPRTWEDLAVELAMIIMGIVVIFLIAVSSVK
jgi:hypothetical protein